MAQPSGRMRQLVAALAGGGSDPEIHLEAARRVLVRSDEAASAATADSFRSATFVMCTSGYVERIVEAGSAGSGQNVCCARAVATDCRLPPQRRGNKNV